MQISECIDQGAHILKTNKVPNPRLESKRILCIALGLSIEESFLYQSRQLSDLDKNLFRNLLLRRAKREPLAYIAQNKEFYGMEFFVNKNVLIPRPDTEIIVEKILAHHKNSSALEILELGVGSGCIIISLLKHMPYAKALGVDLSPDALEVAQKNAISLDVANRITFRQSNWYKNVTGSFDLIISNPPYVNRKSSLSKEISFEPELALFAEKDGLDSYYEIAAGVKNFLKKDGSCYVEIGIESKTKVIEIFAKHSIKAAEIYRDLSQIDRCIRFIP